jgi:hypothetical protein
MALDVPLPVWISRLPKTERKIATQRFYLRLAALYWSESGTLRELSRGCGYAQNSFAALAGREQLSPETAVRVEGLLGRKLFPRERLCPRIFDREAATSL